MGNGSQPPPYLSTSVVSYLQFKKVNAALEAERKAPKVGKKLSKDDLVLPNIWAAIRIALEKDVGPSMVFVGMSTSVTYAMLLPLQNVIRQKYLFNDLQVGLCYM